MTYSTVQVGSGMIVYKVNINFEISNFYFVFEKKNHTSQSIALNRALNARTNHKIDISLQFVVVFEASYFGSVFNIFWQHTRH